MASYLVPLLIAYLPSKVSIGEKLVRHSRGLTARSRLLSSFEAFEFKPAGRMGEYQLLVLYPKQGLPWIFALDEEMSALQLSLFFEIKGLEKRGELLEPNQEGVEGVEGSQVLDAEEVKNLSEGESL